MTLSNFLKKVYISIYFFLKTIPKLIKLFGGCEVSGLNPNGSKNGPFNHKLKGNKWSVEGHLYQCTKESVRTLCLGVHRLTNPEYYFPIVSPNSPSISLHPKYKREFYHYHIFFLTRKLSEKLLNSPSINYIYLVHYISTPSVCHKMCMLYTIGSHAKVLSCNKKKGIWTK